MVNQLCSILQLSLAVFLLVAPIKSIAQSLPEILTSNQYYLPDFSYAGYKFGTEDIPQAIGKVINVNDYGAIADDGLDDTRAIKKAIDAANNIKGPVILKFPKGKLIITEILEITRSNFVMQGAGRGEKGTVLYFPRPLKMVDDEGKLTELREYLVKYNKRQKEKQNNLDVLFSEYSWSAGFIWVGEKNNRGFAYLDKYDPAPAPHLSEAIKGLRGKRQVTLTNNKNNLAVGQRIQLLWHNKQGEHGPLVKSLYDNTTVKIGSRHWEAPDRPLVKQRTVIEKIAGNIITIADPLLHDIDQQLPANIIAWTPLENIGIEDFRFEFPDAPFFGHHVESGYNGIHLTGLADSWARNLSFHNADSAILTYDSANLTIRDVRTTGNRQAHYAVHFGNVHNVLAERIQVFNSVFHSLSFNTQCTKSVYKDSEVFLNPTLDQHAGANHQNLFDNITMHLDAVPDETRASYPVFYGTGAGYWQPGHGQFNTSWNLRLVIESGVPANQTLHVEALEEGPSARVIGLSGNRPLALEYHPKPYIESLNQRIDTIPSLYDFQLAKRKQSK